MKISDYAINTFYVRENLIGVSAQSNYTPKIFLAVSSHPFETENKYFKCVYGYEYLPTKKIGQPVRLNLNRMIPYYNVATKSNAPIGADEEWINSVWKLWKKKLIEGVDTLKFIY